MDTSYERKAWYSSAITSFIGDDCPRLLGLPPAAFARDVLRLEQRLANEGESFLTKTLPALGQNFDRALQGNVPLNPEHFKTVRNTALPAFMQDVHRRIFEDNGWLRADPCIVSIKLLRQLMLWCKKVEKGYSDESLQRATEDLIEVDQALAPPDHVFTGAAVVIARSIIAAMFRHFPRMEYFAPKHGPGAVADALTVIGKRYLTRCYTDLERVFRPIPWFFSLRDASERPGCVTDRIVCKYGLSRIAFVEKDSRGPRVIGLEPAEYMWVQQAVKTAMYTFIETQSLAKGHVNFTDQSINRRLALDWERWITLDMSKASDRNSYALVRSLFGNTKLFPYLHASRTPGTVLPDGRVLMYKKFAPMGSAVCFPVQACVYYALACAGLHIQGMPLQLALKSVYVYGDDLIVPPDTFPGLRDVFSSVGLKFNEDKCCTHGRFRESCGMDAFAGVPVTPVRLRRAHSDDVAQILPSLVAHANALQKAGYWSSSMSFRRAVYDRYPEVRSYKIPTTTDEEVPILAWTDVQDTVSRFWKHQIPHVRGWLYSASKAEVPDDLLVRILRESLSHGGPVGTISRNGRRHLPLKYVGGLRKRSIPYWPR